MKNYTKIIIGIIILIAVGILVFSYTKMPPKQNKTPSGFDWENKSDGVWTKTDLGCMQDRNRIGYTCISNCYENKEVQLPSVEEKYNVWDLGFDLNKSYLEADIKKTNTDTGVEVICFNYGCFPFFDKERGIWDAACPA